MKKRFICYVLSVFMAAILLSGMILPASASGAFAYALSASSFSDFDSLADGQMWLGAAVVFLAAIFLISLAFLVVVIIKTRKKK